MLRNLFASEAPGSIRIGCILLWLAAFCWFGSQVEELGSRGEKGWLLWLDAVVRIYQFMVLCYCVRGIAKLEMWLYWVTVGVSAIAFLAGVPALIGAYPAWIPSTPYGRVEVWMLLWVACWIGGFGFLVSRSSVTLFWRKYKDLMSPSKAT